MTNGYNHNKNLPSYVKDTTEFINHIEATKLLANCKLASIDVSSLYTNIATSQRRSSKCPALLEIKSRCIYKHPEQSNPEILGELMSLVLKHNVFEFDKKFYLQIQGTAMGSKMAPRLEAQLINQAPESIHTWKRFIDDIFIIWTGTTDDYKKYMSNINQIHPTIKFTHEISDSELTFLDVTLYKGERFESTNILDLKTHIKTTNKQLRVYIHLHPITHPQLSKQ